MSSLQRQITQLQKTEIESLLTRIQASHNITKTINATRIKYDKNIKKFDKCYDSLAKTQRNVNTRYNLPLREEQIKYLVDRKSSVVELEIRH